MIARHLAIASLLACSTSESAAVDVGQPTDSSVAADVLACIGACCCDGKQMTPVSCVAGRPVCGAGNEVFYANACSSPPCTGSGRPTDAEVEAETTIDTATDVPTDAGDASACAGACCCQGDVIDTVICSSTGPTCNPMFNVYFGDDCRCLADRDTPCCLPHVDSGK
jgi:hypothetical protein